MNLSLKALSVKEHSQKRLPGGGEPPPPPGIGSTIVFTDGDSLVNY